MDPRRPANPPASRSDASRQPIASAEGRLAQLSTLVDGLAGDDRVPTIVDSPAVENALTEARLGVASSLYTAMRWKHEPTAQHCLRTALCCSGWSVLMSLPADIRDDLEVAALLHDIGKIGVLDGILCKPAGLNAQEGAIMDCHWLMGEQVLRAGCASPGAIEVMRYARAWFDGRRGNLDKTGDDLPLGSRMLAIADAFDSMTTDQIYRRAMSAQRAFDELFRCAGTQFDPDLVTVFSKLFEKDPLAMQQAAAERWLTSLSPEGVQKGWRSGQATGGDFGPLSQDALFQQKLVDNMNDAVIFVDANLKVVCWNRGAERLTGISAAGMTQRLFLPSALKLCDETNTPIGDADCPMAIVVRTGVQFVRRLHIGGRGGKSLPVDAHASPVVDAAGTVVGMTLLMHDVSPEISLEQRCQNLHELATRDPLTQAANRAEFDRVQAEFIKAHRDDKRPCSLIMTDIDRFKSINDTYGHQAGDVVIQAIAKMMKNFCRPGDLVARYGGEEFAMLCADCDNATAARRAEEVRVAFSRVRHDALGERSVTASFGVTEVQPGDTPETMLRRADRALMTAKESGRNRVVQLGIGGDAQEDEGKVSAASTRKRLAGNMLLKREMVSDSPMERNIEKLEGFIADHHAEVTLAERNRVQLRIGGDRGGPLFKRSADRTIKLMIDLMLNEETFAPEGNSRATFKRTRITVMISPLKTRERRTADALDRARQLVVSLRAYLMAADIDGVEAVTEEAGGLWQTVRSLFGGGRTPVEA
jgi:diguanylate cyclase (GGDEF)-like protein